MAATYFPDGHFTPHNYRAGSCFICGASDNTKKRQGIVRIFKDDRYDFLICNLCAIDIGGSVDMIVGDKVHAMRVKNRKQGQQIKDLTNEVKELEDLVERMASFKEART